jgi:hypothetical protein
MDNTIITAIDVISQAFLGIVGLLISWALYQQSKQRAKDTWLRTYAEIHSSFWNDPEIQQVRYWLAYPSAYKAIKEVLIKRRLIDNGAENIPDLVHEEYEMLDKLDKYLNLLLRAITINPKTLPEYDMWNALHFKYWLNACLDTRRDELIWYISKFYPQLYEFGQRPELREYGKRIGFER